MPTDPERAVSYAALILADDATPITPEKLQVLLKAAGIEDVEPIWTTLFAKALEGKDVKDILTEVASAAGGVVAGGKIVDGKFEENAEEKDGEKDGGDEEGSDDEDMYGDFGLFD
ncbi:hypothetical protein HBH64_034410 [Parastagonospora nodorum]|nr:hypothetical protein HBH49_068250 [Parastagonospora nodorum]KAH4130936.1 hypothetical protein HBH47_016430 [Parastagonospora nodorum]KAH4232060.1 hypothetical protein HBI06_075570 [Parastagonospora nodorum]KAH4245939.1 hypothetical protein HBI05_058790 [Parastagonospora nodorum]KAH4308029.1 hypothetical protein HBI01_044420 [Parastagonospora nodorum]